MERKIKTEQEKRKTRRKVFIIIVILLVILSVAGLLVWKYVLNHEDKKEIVPVKILDTMGDYDYSISDRDTNYYKSEFENLKKILNASEIDEEAYATQVARMFTIDLYTISTKVNKYDVGGSEYFHKDKKDMFEQKVIDTLYSIVLDDTYGDRKQVLPEISSVETISTEKTTYEIGEQQVEGYLVKLKMAYTDTNGYDKEASVVVCKQDDKKWSVVDFQPTLNPKYEKNNSN